MKQKYYTSFGWTRTVVCVLCGMDSIIFVHYGVLIYPDEIRVSKTRSRAVALTLRPETQFLVGYDVLILVVELL